MTRKLAKEVLQGDIMVTSEVGKGSIFGLIIPQNITTSVKEYSGHASAGH